MGLLVIQYVILKCYVISLSLQCTSVKVNKASTLRAKKRVMSNYDYKALRVSWD